MKIINFTKHDDGSFIVSIKGVRGIPYQVFFSEQAIMCDCPDYQKHSVKPICKHMFKCICLSENHDIFNNIMLLTDLMNPEYLGRILENIMRIIDVKKMERYGGPQNPISIERDEYCSICYGDFDTDIAECLKCKHVFHQNCISLSWSSASHLSRGKCPMCRAPNSFPQFGGFNNNDPWEIYNFQPPPAVEEPLAAVEEPLAAVEEPPPAVEELPAAVEELPAAVEEPLAAVEELPAAVEEPLAAVEELPAAVEEPLAAVEEPLAQQDILLNSEVEQNANSNIPIEVEQNENNVFFQNEPFFPVEENFGDNSDTPTSSPPPLPSIEESDSSLLQEDDFEIIDRRIKILNISLFILETVNIILNNIYCSFEQPE
jgi:hypothetical protein